MSQFEFGGGRVRDLMFGWTVVLDILVVIVVVGGGKVVVEMGLQFPSVQVEPTKVWHTVGILKSGTWTVESSSTFSAIIEGTDSCSRRLRTYII